MRRRPFNVIGKLAVTMALAAAALVAPRFEAAAQTVIPTRAATVSAAVTGEAVLELPFAAQHVALHWVGHPDAEVSVAFSPGDGGFGPMVAAGRDETGEGHPSGQTFGAVLAAGGATRLRVQTDRPIGRLNALALADGEPQPSTQRTTVDQAGATDGKPPVVNRRTWGADPGLLYRGTKLVWPLAFARVQKLVVHHTATSNNYETQDEAMGEIRAIYYYHAVTLGWGDIGYNFLIDRLGFVYEGRFSGDAGLASPTGEDTEGRVVTAGHTYQHNVGTVGVALLGLDNLETDPLPLKTDAARESLRSLLTWEASRHHLDPAKIAPYRNLINDVVRTGVPNLAGHRDYVATECPGGSFYTWLTAPDGLRVQLRALLPDAEGDITVPPMPTGLSAVGARRKATVTWNTTSTESWPSQSGIAYYEIQRRTTLAGTFAAVEHVADHVGAFTDTPARGSYEYRTVAVDGAGNVSLPSAAVTVTVT